MKRRAEVLFDKILRYSYETLTESDTCPNNLSTPEHQGAKDFFYTMLFNDEIHTYDQVTVFDQVLAPTTLSPVSTLTPDIMNGAGNEKTEHVHELEFINLTY